MVFEERCSTHSRGEGNSNEDSAQWVLLSIDSHRRTDLQIPKGVQTANVFSFGLPGHVAKVGTLEDKTLLQGKFFCFVFLSQTSLLAAKRSAKKMFAKDCLVHCKQGKVRKVKENGNICFSK